MTQNISIIKISPSLLPLSLQATLERVSTLLVKFYPTSTPDPPSSSSSSLTLVSPSSSLFMIPLVCELVSDCLTRFKDSLPHLRLTSSLLSAISHVSVTWVDHVTKLVGCPYKVNGEADAHSSLMKFLTELLNKEENVELTRKGEESVTADQWAWSFNDVELKEELVIDCCISVFYAGKGGGDNNALSTGDTQKLLMELCEVSE